MRGSIIVTTFFITTISLMSFQTTKIRFEGEY